MENKKVIVCKCNHGFTLSQRQKALFPGTPDHLVDRADEKLVSSFEAGDQRGDGGSTLVLLEIPKDAHYVISECDGAEKLYWSMSPIQEL
jgi:hypothetical protein